VSITSVLLVTLFFNFQVNRISVKPQEAVHPAQNRQEDSRSQQHRLLQNGWLFHCLMYFSSCIRLFAVAGKHGCCPCRRHPPCSVAVCAFTNALELFVFDDLWKQVKFLDVSRTYIRMAARIFK